MIRDEIKYFLNKSRNYSGCQVHSSAPPLATEVASLIKKVTLALRSHIRGLSCSFYQLTLNREPLNFEPE